MGWCWDLNIKSQNSMNVWFLHQNEYNNQSKYKDVQFTPMIMYAVCVLRPIFLDLGLHDRLTKRQWNILVGYE